MTQKHVIVAIGRTGIGKSTFGNCLGCCFKASNSRGSVTKTPSFQVSSDKKYLYLDTPGFLDTDNSEECSDLEHQRRILKAFQESGQDSVHTVLWFSPITDRSDKTLQWEAKFIQSLGDADTGGKSIWNNVIIIIKKGNDGDGGGAVGEAAMHSGGVEPTVKGLNLFNHNTQEGHFSMTLNSEMRIKEGYLKDGEVSSWIDSLVKDGGTLKIPSSSIYLTTDRPFE
ncbi:hypothetical protein BC937DRAFT_86658 [Endogone sp. FLAS-F59071]|nr:hypothetical protein BC937DRAFT_86658 [Endogone sp. FLAS-F59071]|eukprot:RUS12933.1 hypothetical protein BC937DRAFT_86658 [Endogone sp. FLAS-F59071]